MTLWVQCHQNDCFQSLPTINLEEHQSKIALKVITITILPDQLPVGFYILIITAFVCLPWKSRLQMMFVYGDRNTSFPTHGWLWNIKLPHHLITMYLFVCMKGNGHKFKKAWTRRLWFLISKIDWVLFLSSMTPLPSSEWKGIEKNQYFTTATRYDKFLDLSNIEK